MSTDSDGYKFVIMLDMKWMLQGVFLCVLIAAFYPQLTKAETDAERRARLEQELQTVERQILTQQRLVEDKQVERQSLERDLTIIEGQISKAQLGIQARSIAIEQLTDQIGEKEEAIIILSEKLNRQEQSLADLVRKSAARDDVSLVEILLSKKNFSEFFSEFEQYTAIKEALNDSLSILHEIKQDNHEQKKVLATKQETEAEMKEIQELQKNEIESKEKEKEKSLTTTKGQEAEYQRLLKSQQQTAAELRNALFNLLGGGGGISLPQAVEFAQYASKQTGVAASLILAILEQETNLGANLGSCAYNDIRGDKAVMHPDRDQPIFLAIANILGFDARSRSVSCPLVSGGQRVGWGGAMGPSQFIPSTWAVYGGIVNTGNGWVYSESSDAIRRLNGGTPANPFNNRDAFIATALLLRDNVANGTYAGDRLSALRYYAGWGGANNPANAFYGDGVMNRKAKFEGQIRILGGG
jgi:peptidoglycan hydrolase CwlO-like protein